MTDESFNSNAVPSAPQKETGTLQHIKKEMEWRKTHNFLEGISEEKIRETNREWNVSEHHGASHSHLMGRVDTHKHGADTPWDAPIEFDERAVKLAAQAVEECRTSLMMAFRYLDRALWKLPMETAGIAAALASDGETLYFNPVYVISRYRQSPYELARDLLHTVLHCVFRHPFPTLRDYPKDWITTCDVLVESAALEMCAGRFPCERDARRVELVESVTKRMGGIVPSKLYRALQRAYDARYEGGADALTKAEAIELEMLFHRDDPAPWTLENEVVTSPDPDTSRPDGAHADGPHEEDSNDTAGSGTDEDTDGGQTDAIDDRSPESGEDGASADGAGADTESNDDANAQPDDADSEEDEDELDNAAGNEGNQATQAAVNDQTRDEWEEIAKRIEVDMRTMSHAQSSQAGIMMTNLALSNRRRIDYADFLRQFSAMSEDMRINPDEFDYIFYTYGLALYGNRPLVEPLEYQEHNRVREFVIALDTSGSCSGELIRTFVARTFEILKQGELFGGEVNVHIVQCDAKVQNDTVIESLAELERYTDDFQVFGLGGTDFRPVFDYVGELIAKGELSDLRGLIYFTDGLGIYPDAMPPYDTAFVFVEDEGQPRFVPPWAMKVVLDEDQIRELGNASPALGGQRIQE